MQDQGLDLLHGVILRQKSMAQQIGVEVTQQNHLIDDIGERGEVLPVLWIRDIFVWILFCGAVLVLQLQDANKKQFFSAHYFLHFHHLSKIKSQKEVSKQ